VYAHWTNNIGQYVIQQAKILIGGSVIDTLNSELLFIWEELAGRSGRRLGEMTGKRYTRSSLICDSRSARIFYIPLPFYFCQHSGNALPLASLQFHGVQVQIDWAKLADCIVVSGPGVAVKHAGRMTAITDNDIEASLEATYVYLDNAERERFATSQFEVLCTQNQFHTFGATPLTRCQLMFNHPVQEIFWVVRRKCQERAANWFNFSGLHNKDPVEWAKLELNNQARFHKPGQYFRLVQPYQHHSCIPDSYVYVYSFALHPEDSSPSGSCNFSRVDHVTLTLGLQPGLCTSNSPCDVHVFARSWNVLRFREGLAGLAYAS
jgi:hypothetical protein